MNNLHIIDSYKNWDIETMNKRIIKTCVDTYNTMLVEKTLNRPFESLYIEWWLHNIGYYLTKPFPALKNLNLRFKDVDLNSW